MGIIDIYGFRVQPTRALVWARTFQPNVIFSSPVSVAIARLTIEIARTLAVPFVFHAMDDELGSLARYDPTKERKLAGQLFSEARYSYVISHQMAASYQRRYGVTCEVLANAIDLSNWPTGVSASKQGGRQFVLVYMGAIWKDMQLPSFADICDAVAQLATEGWPVELQIYTHRMFEERYRAKLERIPSVCFCGSKPYDEIPSSLAGADLLILPVTFDSQALVFTRDSMPTKIPEYMASGTPVLLYGPAEAAPIAYARDQGWGHVVTEQGVGNVKQAILELLSDPAKRMAYATRARELAEQNHNLEIVRPRLWERLCRVAAEISGHAN